MGMVIRVICIGRSFQWLLLLAGEGTIPFFVDSGLYFAPKSAEGTGHRVDLGVSRWSCIIAELPAYIPSRFIRERGLGDGYRTTLAQIIGLECGHKAKDEDHSGYRTQLNTPY